MSAETIVAIIVLAPIVIVGVFCGCAVLWFSRSEEAREEHVRWRMEHRRRA